MIEIEYSYNKKPRMEAAEWKGSWQASPIRVIVPKKKDTKSLAVCLHEFGHVAQVKMGWEEEQYQKHHLFSEAEASALALVFMKPQVAARMFDVFAGYLSEHATFFCLKFPMAYDGLAENYLMRHVNRIQRKWGRK